MAPARWTPAYVGLGSNLDRPSRQIEAAVGMLDAIERTRVMSVSSLYRSAPLGGIEQPDFVNAVATLLTQLDAESLLGELHEIERRRGRERDGSRWGPRVIDLDLLVFGDRVSESDGLRLPHPGIVDRNFVLLPLREIAPDLDIPGLGRVAAIEINEGEPRIARVA